VGQFKLAHYAAPDRAIKDGIMRGFITVVEGSVARFHLGKQLTLVPGGKSLHAVLEDLKSLGWYPEGDLPPYTAEGTYTIDVVKR
jgi:hypothetical protein